MIEKKQILFAFNLLSSKTGPRGWRKYLWKYYELKEALL